MIKTYTEDLTAANPATSTDETTPAPGEPKWAYSGTSVEWVSGKGIGEIDPYTLFRLREVHQGCALKLLSANVIIEDEGTVLTDFEASISIAHPNMNVYCRLGKRLDTSYLAVSLSLYDANGDHFSYYEQILSSLLNIKIIENVSSYDAKINDVTVLSIDKFPSNDAYYVPVNDTQPSFNWQCINGTNQKAYLKNIHIEYDEFVDSPFWTDLVNCHEVTT